MSKLIPEDRQSVVVFIDGQIPPPNALFRPAFHGFLLYVSNHDGIPG